MPVSVNQFSTTSECKTCLGCHIDKYLELVTREATDSFTYILTGEDRFNQGREFMGSECASDQTFMGWSVEGEAISTRYVGGEGGLRAYYTRIRRLWSRREDPWAPSRGPVHL